VSVNGVRTIARSLYGYYGKRGG